MIVDEHGVAVGEGGLVGGHTDSEAVGRILRKEGGGRTSMHRLRYSVGPVQSTVRPDLDVTLSEL